MDGFRLHRRAVIGEHSDDRTSDGAASRMLCLDGSSWARGMGGSYGSGRAQPVQNRRLSARQQSLQRSSRVGVVSRKVHSRRTEEAGLQPPGVLRTGLRVQATEAIKLHVEPYSLQPSCCATPWRAEPAAYLSTTASVSAYVGTGCVRGQARTVGSTRRQPTLGVARRDPSGCRCRSGSDPTARAARRQTSRPGQRDGGSRAARAGG